LRKRLFGVPISQGNVAALTARGARRLEGGFLAAVRTAPAAAHVVHFHKAGFRVAGRLHIEALLAPKPLPTRLRQRRESTNPDVLAAGTASFRHAALVGVKGHTGQPAGPRTAALNSQLDRRSPARSQLSSAV
jgi:hypothetical protein